MAYNEPLTFKLLQSLPASNSASIAFTGIGSFNTYYVSFKNIVPVTNNDFLLMTFSTDNGSTYLNSGYKYFSLNELSAPTETGQNSNAGTSLQLTYKLSSATAKAMNGGMYLYALNQSTFVPQYQGQAVYIDDASGNCVLDIFSGMNTGTTAINAIKFTCSTGNISSGTFLLYGVQEP